jgi:tetratricopeptide (TPR) repeat protein
METLRVTANADTLSSRAAQLIAAGRIGAARPLLAAASALAPLSAEITLISARLALASDALEQALDELDRGLATMPSHSGLRKCRADVHQRMGDLDGAARDAAEAVVSDPADPEAKAILGAVMLALGYASDSAACLADALAAAPLNLDYRRAFAAALEKAGNVDDALAVLTDGIALSPASVTLRNAAILICIRRRDFNRAVWLGEDARSLGISDACTFGMQGHALSSLGQHDQAALAYLDALKLGPEDTYVRHGMCQRL